MFATKSQIEPKLQMNKNREQLNFTIYFITMSFLLPAVEQFVAKLCLIILEIYVKESFIFF